MGLEDNPLVNLPTDSKEHKIVQLWLDKKPCILFGPVYTGRGSDALHTQILGDFLSKSEIPFKTDVLRHNDIVPEGERYCLVGAGKGIIVPEKKIALFYGHSQGYDVQIDMDHLWKTQPLVPDWQLVTNATHCRSSVLDNDREIISIIPKKQ